MAISINEANLKLVLMEIGCPPLDPTQLEISVNDIKELCIEPALTEFFIWNPLCVNQEIEVPAGEFSIPAPDALTLGIVDARLIPLTARSSMQTRSPFLNERLYQVGASRNIRGPAGAAEIMEAKAFERRLAQSIENVYGSRLVKYDHASRSVKGFATSPCVLSVTWGKITASFEEIDPLRQREALKLAKAYTLRAFGQIRGQQNSNTGVEWNYQMFLERADKLEEEILEKWRLRTKVVIMRG